MCFSVGKFVVVSCLVNCNAGEPRLTMTWTIIDGMLAGRSNWSLHSIDIFTGLPAIRSVLDTESWHLLGSTTGPIGSHLARKPAVVVGQVEINSL